MIGVKQQIYKSVEYEVWVDVVKCVDKHIIYNLRNQFKANRVINLSQPIESDRQARNLTTVNNIKRFLENEIREVDI